MPSEDIKKKLEIFEKIDRRLDKVEQEIVKANKGMWRLKKSIEVLEHVEVNGMKGFEDVLKELYVTITALKTQEATHWWNKPVKYFFTTKSVLSKFLWLLIGYLVLNSIFHAFGISIDGSIFTKLFQSQ